MSENKFTHADKMTIFLAIAKQHLTDLQDCLRLARAELDEDSSELQEKAEIEQALGQVATCSTWVAQAFDNQALKKVVKTCRGIE